MRFTFNLALTPRRTLHVVLALRWIAVAIQLAVLAYAVYFLQIPLPVEGLLAGTALLAASGVGLGWRMRQSWPVTELEVSLHLLVDVAILTWLLYLAGGSSNPFVSAYLVPVALAAVALRPRYGVVITTASIAVYTFLLKFYLPLPLIHDGLASEFELHVFGMWVNFILSACLIAGLIWVMAENIRRRDRLIAAAREDALRSEHIVGLGLLAAGAAHELSTPLSTIALVAEELENELADQPSAREDLRLLKQQIAQCKVSLSTLLASASQAQPESATAVHVGAFLEQTVERWRLLRPEVTLSTTVSGRNRTALLRPGHGLSQALINLLNNAADASLTAGHTSISLSARVNADRLVIEIEDNGPGLGEAAQAMAGRAAFSTKPGGAGLGLLLSNTTLSRWGGILSLESRPNGGGTITRVTLPLSHGEGVS